MVRVQAGDLTAFERLVERTQSMVHGLAISILGTPEDAEEAAQDTYVKLFRSRDSFDPDRSLEPWLLRIAGNACRDLLRRRRVAGLPHADTGPELLPLLEDAEGQEATERADNDQLVRTELAKLSVQSRQPLVLKYLAGMTNQQIADALGISVSNVKVRLARAKDLLQRRLEKVLES